MGFSEKRQTIRERANAYGGIVVHIGSEEFDQAFCVLIDVSNGGIRVRTPQPPQLHSSVTVRVALGEEIHQLQAFVVHVKKAFGEAHDVGLALFMHPAEIEAFVERVQAHERARYALMEHWQPD